MRITGTACALGLLFWSNLALAAGDEALSPTERAELASLTKDALTHAKKGEYDAARVSYARVYEKFPTTPVLFYLALSELRSGHELEALHHFDVYVEMGDAEKPKIELVRKELRPKAYAATGHVLVEGAAPAGARITVDGQELQDKDARLVDVTAGDHEVMARTKDATWRAHVNAVAGQSTTVSFELVAQATPAPAAPPPRPAPDTSTQAQHEPAPAEHGEGASFWNSRRVTTAVILGAGVVAAGTGVAFVLESNSSASHASDVRTQLGTSGACAPPIPAGNQSQCDDLRNSRNQQDTFHNVSTGLFIGAGVLALGAAVTYAVWPSRADVKRGAIVPFVDPTSKTGGVVARFAF